MKSWILYTSVDCEALAEDLSRRKERRIAGGEFTQQDVLNIRNRPLDFLSKNLEMSPERLEMLRKLCQLWDVDIRPAMISSHRKVLGPIVVRVKKLLFPLVRFFLKDLIREQRAFNAAVITILSDICNERKS